MSGQNYINFLFKQGINHVEDIGRQVAMAKLSKQQLFLRQVLWQSRSSATKFMKQYEFFPNMLDTSRFNSQLHKVR